MAILDKYKEVEFYPADMTPDKTKPPLLSTRAATTQQGAHYDSWDFDASTREQVYMQFMIPEDWDDTNGEFSVKPYWEADATSGDVTWLYGFAPIADGENLDASFTVNSRTDTVAGSARFLTIHAARSLSTAAPSASAGDLVTLVVSRSAPAGSDTMLGDARLLKVVVQYHTLGANNAQWGGSAPADGFEYREKFYPADKFVLDKTVPPMAGTRQETTLQGAHYPFLAFDADAVEAAYLNIMVPEDIATATSYAIRMYWETSSTSGDVRWAVGKAFVNDNEDIDATLPGTSLNGDTAKGTARYLAVAERTVGFSDAKGDLGVIQIWRQATNGADTMTGDARLIGIGIQWSAEIANNAQWS